MIVWWSDAAIDDLEKIYDYIDFRNPQAALRVKVSIVESGNLLRDFPEVGETVDRPEIRRRVVTGLPYILFYRITAEMVEILSILDARMDRPPDLQ